jgi:hypothetical protein
MQFMAIEVLQGNRYTYRHRLESFSRPYLDVHSSHTPFTGTYKDRSIMYDGMINAFNKAISHLGQE